MIRTLGWLLGIENATAIDRLDVSLAAPWAQDGAFWVFLIAAALWSRLAGLLSPVAAEGPARPADGARRVSRHPAGAAAPHAGRSGAAAHVVNRQRPLLYVIFDGTDSMAIEDELPDAERAAIEKAVGWTPARSVSEGPATQQQTQALAHGLRPVAAPQGPRQPADAARPQDKQVQLEAFMFDGNTTSQLRKLSLSTRQPADGSIRSIWPSSSRRRAK